MKYYPPPHCFWASEGGGGGVLRTPSNAVFLLSIMVWQNVSLQHIYIYITYIYLHTHTHTHLCIYVYNEYVHMDVLTLIYNFRVEHLNHVYLTEIFLGVGGGVTPPKLNISLGTPPHPPPPLKGGGYIYIYMHWTKNACRFIALFRGPTWDPASYFGMEGYPLNWRKGSMW